MIKGITPATAPAHISQPMFTGPGTYGCVPLATSAAWTVSQTPAGNTKPPVNSSCNSIACCSCKLAAQAVVLTVAGHLLPTTQSAVSGTTVGLVTTIEQSDGLALLVPDHPFAGYSAREPGVTYQAV